MSRTPLLVVTALGEAGTGLLLLIRPALPLALLLGVEQASPEVVCAARILGVALVAIAVACWQARNDHAGPAQKGVLQGVLVYDVGAAAVLAYAGWAGGLAGIALWPAVVLHSALAVWSALSLRRSPVRHKGSA
jgi:hypothetical protein